MNGMDSLEHYYKHLTSKGISTRTIDVTMNYLLQFYNWMREQGIRSGDEFTDRELIAYRDSLRDKQKTSSVNQRIQKLNQFNNFLIDVGMRKSSYKNKDLLIPVDTHPDIAVASAEEFERLRDVVDRERNPRDILLFHLIFEVGLKPSQIVKLKLSEVEYGGNYSSAGRIYLDKQKGKFIEVAHETLSLIDSHLRSRKTPMEFVFDGYKEKPLNVLTVNAILRKYSDLAGLDKMITPHSLRNAFVSSLLKQGYSPDEISSRLRMSKHNFMYVYRRLF
jgi:integrase/recombinase XerD